MNKFLEKVTSLYRPEFYKTLVAMLQENEYELKPYLTWFWHRRSFLFGPHAQRYQATAKAKLLLALFWAEAFGLLILAFWVLFAWYFKPEDIAILLLSLAIFIAIPVVVAHSAPLIVIIGTLLIQKPKKKKIIAQATKQFADFKGTVIAVAGSYGKTSMKEMLASVLAAEKKVAATPGNYNTPLGVSAFMATLAGDEDILVVEMGEYHPGEIYELCKITQPDIGVITGINEQHHERFKTIEAAVSTIFELADYLGGKPLYVNGETPYGRERIKDRHKVYTKSGVGGWKVKEPKTSIEGTQFLLQKGPANLKINSKLLGVHQIGPLSAAASLASDLGISKSGIEKGIVSIEPTEHRFQILDQLGATIIDDSYNGNPTGFETGIAFLDGLKNVKRKVYVTPGIFELGDAERGIHFELGKKLGRSSINAIIFIKTEGTEIMAQGIADIGGSQKITWVDQPEDFYGHIDLYTKTGDVVLLQNSAPGRYLKK